MEGEGEDFAEIPGFRGDTRWYQRGEHVYIAYRTAGLSTYLRCHKSKCPVTWALRAGQPGPLRGEHNHEPILWVKNRNLLFQSLKRRCSSEPTLPRQIYEEEAIRHPDAAPHLPFDGVVSSMRFWRRQVLPPVPRVPKNQDSKSKRRRSRKTGTTSKRKRRTKTHEEDAISTKLEERYADEHGDSLDCEDESILDNTQQGNVKNGVNIVEWSSNTFQQKLYSEHRILCHKHFKKTSFINFEQKKLHRHAVPEEECEEVLVFRQQTFEPTPGLFDIDGNNATSPSNTSRIQDILQENSSNKTTLPETGSFSWQKNEEQVLEEDLETETIDEADAVEAALAVANTPSGYHCNICLAEIIGFRYVCVQCLDWDLCGACEARGAHPHHYVLRIPAQRPRDEVRATLRTIRRVLADAIVHVDEPNTHTVRVIKTEADYCENDPIEVDPSSEMAEYTTLPHPKHKQLEIYTGADEDFLYSDEDSDTNSAKSIPEKAESDQKANRADVSAAESHPKVAESKQDLAKMKLVPDIKPLKGKMIRIMSPQGKVIQKVPIQGQLQGFKGKIDQTVPLRSNIVHKMSMNTTSANITGLDTITSPSPSGAGVAGSQKFRFIEKKLFRVVKKPIKPISSSSRMPVKQEISEVVGVKRSKEATSTTADTRKRSRLADIPPDKQLVITNEGHEVVVTSKS